MSDEGVMGESTTKRVGSHYVLDDVLGRGSMGTVWRGHDLSLLCQSVVNLYGADSPCSGLCRRRAEKRRPVIWTDVTC